MNNVLYRQKYNEISAYIANELNVASAFKNFNPEALIECDTFAAIDRFIINWVNDRLLDMSISVQSWET